jgi:hypothetical protein
MTTPKSNPSKHYKHFRKAVAFRFRKLELCRLIWSYADSFSEVGVMLDHFQDFRPAFRFWHICHVDRHGHFTLKQLRLPVLNETHTNIYTGPRLSSVLKSVHVSSIVCSFEFCTKKFKKKYRVAMTSMTWATRACVQCWRNYEHFMLKQC